MNSRGSITLGELVGKLDLLEIKCHRCERHGRVSLARLVDKHGADIGLPDLWQSLAGDCQHARSTALAVSPLFDQAFQRPDSQRKPLHLTHATA